MSFFTRAVVLAQLAPPKPFQARRMAVGPAVPLHLVEPIEGNIQGVAAGELQNQIVAVETLHRETLKASIFGDAMLDMDDIVAHVEIFQRREERCRFAFRLWLVARALRKQLFFRQHGQAQVRRKKSSRQIAVQDIKRRFGFARHGPGSRCPSHRRHIVLAQERQQSVHLAATSCDEYHAGFISQAIHDGEGLAEGHATGSKAGAGRSLSRERPEPDSMTHRLESGVQAQAWANRSCDP